MSQGLSISKSSSNLNYTPALSTYLCNETFKNTLRQNSNKVHNEHRMIEVKRHVPKKREQVSNVFRGEACRPPRPHVAHVHVPSQVMFNDSYFELNPSIKKGKLLRYKVEKEVTLRSNKYSDELHLPGDKQYSIQQKIKDNYSRNPLSIKVDTLDQASLTRSIMRSEHLARCNSSIQVKRSLRNLRPDPTPTEPLSKITNDGFQDGRAINLSQSNRGKKHFKVASVGENGLMYC